MTLFIDDILIYSISKGKHLEGKNFMSSFQSVNFGWHKHLDFRLCFLVGSTSFILDLLDIVVQRPSHLGSFHVKSLCCLNCIYFVFILVSVSRDLVYWLISGRIDSNSFSSNEQIWNTTLDLRLIIIWAKYHVVVFFLCFWTF